MTNSTNTRKSTKSTVVATEPGYTVAVDPENRRRWFVVRPDGSHIDGIAYTSKRDALTEAQNLDIDARQNAKAAAKAEAEAAVANAPKAGHTSPADLPAVRPTVDEPDTLEDIPAYLAGLPFAEVIERAKPERDALREWVASGSKGKRPSTIVLDWMSLQNLNCKPAKAERAPRVKGEAATRTPEQQARFVEILTEARDAGGKWHQAAKKLTEESIPTSRGGGWYYSTVQGLAKSLGLI